MTPLSHLLEFIAAQYTKMKAASKISGVHVITGISDVAATNIVQSAELTRATLDLLTRLQDKIGYELAMIEQHTTGALHTYCAFVLCQTSKGVFSKWSKALGGYSPESGSSGDFLLFEDYLSAKAALDHIDPIIRDNFKIFPVVMCADSNPVTKDPHGRYR